MLSLLEAHDDIVLIAHYEPDADTLGGASALYSYLLRLGKRVRWFCASTIHPSMHFIPWSNTITSHFPHHTPCVVSVDCASYQRMGVQLDPNICLINIDHHASNTHFGTHNFIDTHAMSTTQIIYRLFVAQGIKINAKMALSLYAGMIDDSKCFKSPSSNQELFSMASHLIACGADHARCIDALYQRRSLAALRLKGALLQAMELVVDGQLAIFELNGSLLERTGASAREAKRILDEALELSTVQMALLFYQRSEVHIDLSLKSKAPYSAHAILEHYGGGGHAQRAGAQIQTHDYQHLRHTLIETIRKELTTGGKI